MDAVLGKPLIGTDPEGVIDFIIIHSLNKVVNKGIITKGITFIDINCPAIISV